MKNTWSLLPIILSIISLFLEQQTQQTVPLLIIINLLDVSVVLLLILETVRGFKTAPYKTIYARNNFFALAFTAGFILLFLYAKINFIRYRFLPAELEPSLSAVILKNTFLVLKVLTRFRKLHGLLESISLKPAQTILLSFLLVILAGSLLLMMPFTAEGESGLSFLDALFTSTSAVCVTGLIVVDTATAFSFWGQLIIVILIQIGGLGIMILSYFSFFLIRRGISRDEKLIAAYMLSQDDMQSIQQQVKMIILTTFGLEFAGALLLYLFVPGIAGSHGGRIFGAVFHGVSAFCNAGFALFSDSLESFTGSLALNLIIVCLIIAGGLSFSVHSNLGRILIDKLRGKPARERLTVNSRTVLVVSGLLIAGGTIFFYGLEHNGVLRPLATGNQYLSAFFQSVTLRTAGFNTLPLGSLGAGTYLFMCFLMFIGGASGSTAGGIKVNSLAAIAAHFKAQLSESRSATLFRNTVSSANIMRAFTISAFGIFTVSAGTLLLMIFEKAPPMHILFEAVSAFGTVGLSAGITSSLSPPGKLVIICMMFLGRIGPLTVLAAAGRRRQNIDVEYPSAELSIG